MNVTFGVDLIFSDRHGEPSDRLKAALDELARQGLIDAWTIRSSHRGQNARMGFRIGEDLKLHPITLLEDPAAYVREAVSPTIGTAA